MVGEAVTLGKITTQSMASLGAFSIVVVNCWDVMGCNENSDALKHRWGWWKAFEPGREGPQRGHTTSTDATTNVFEINKKEETPFHVASRCCHEKSVAKMREPAGNYRSEGGCTPWTSPKV